MEKRATQIRKMIWISVSIILIFLIILYNIGIKVDYIIWTEEIKQYQSLNSSGLLVSIVCSAVMFFTMAELKKYMASLFICLLILCFSIGTLGYSLLSMPDWDQIYKEQQQEYLVESQTANIVDVSWSQVLKAQRGEKYALLYIGRDDCEKCKEFKPALGEIAYEKEIKVLYYNTIEDRGKNDFDQKMNALKVKSVPAVKIVGKNKVIDLKDERVTGTSVQLKQYLAYIKKVYNL